MSLKFEAQTGKGRPNQQITSVHLTCGSGRSFPSSSATTGTGALNTLEAPKLLVLPVLLLLSRRTFSREKNPDRSARWALSDPEEAGGPKIAMAVPWGTTLWVARLVWVALRGWLSSCLTVADDVASSIRTGDIGPFHVG